MFKDSFAQLLAERDVSAYKLAQDTGFSQGMISNWRSGRRLPAAENLVTLAEYFGVSVDFLLGADGREAAMPQEAAAAGSDGFLQIFASLTPQQQEIILTLMREMQK